MGNDGRIYCDLLTRQISPISPVFGCAFATACLCKKPTHSKLLSTSLEVLLTTPPASFASPQTSGQQCGGSWSVWREDETNVETSRKHLKTKHFEE